MNKLLNKYYLLIVFLSILFLFNFDEFKAQQINNEIELGSLLELQLTGEIAERNFEGSGLAWYKDNLILLPQFPHKFSDENDGALFYITKERIEKYLNGEDRTPLSGNKINFIAHGLDEIGKVKGSGYEAITFVGDTLFVSIESVKGSITTSYLVRGIIYFEEKKIILDGETKVEIKSQSGLYNMAEETIFTYGKSVYTLHEVNGKNVNSDPVSNKFDFSFNDVEKIPFPNIEFRITDATETDSDGKFWVLNYFYPGDYSSLKPDTDNLKGFDKDFPVERIIELQIVKDRIRPTSKKPIYLNSTDYSNGRNWEGIVKFGEDGFLIITDRYPKTILGYLKFKKN